ncbi:MAG: hypothetical protein GXO36_05385 [Chloroflexi bacterium]|nr:hypothetical protein [Chloroflexota bacterium]
MRRRKPSDTRGAVRSGRAGRWLVQGWRWFRRGAATLGLLLGVYAAWVHGEIYAASRGRIVPLDEAPPRPVAVVFGAAVYAGGRPSPILEDRVRTAVDLYHAGKVKKLLMSGDNRTVHYNEPAAMIALARSLGVPDEALAADYAGRRTYDTCWRAKNIFGLDEVILVTQRFHLPRAIYLCRAVGLDPIGVPADRRTYRGLWWFGGAREFLARLRAWWDVHVWPPPVVGGEPIPLFP